MVVNKNGTIDQITHYYPYGELMADISTNPTKQEFKYGGKELDRTYGLDLYDFEARQYDAVTPWFTSIDPLAEKYYSISPYADCAGDPENLIDPAGLAPTDTTGLKIAGHIYDGKVGDVVDGYECLEIKEISKGSIRMGLHHAKFINLQIIR